MAKIAIDSGHGGHDPGAVGKNSKEKDNALKVAKRLKILLESHGHAVRLTRSTDVYLTLAERARVANAWGADYFISLHNNAAVATATGFETFIHNGPVQSKTASFQNAIHAAIIKGIGIRDRGKKRANFSVLRETRMPAVLIEYAFISNISDEKILINEAERLAQLTANGVVDFAGSNKPAIPKPEPPEEEEEKLNLNKNERAEIAQIFKKAREQGVFSSAEHEKTIVDGTMTLSRLQYLQTVIAGAGINGGKRIK